MNPNPHRFADMVANAGAEPGLDQIVIEGLVGETVIGIFDDELRAPQPLKLDVVAGVLRPRACDSDAIGDTLDYSVLRARLLRLMREHRVQLLESFAEQVARIVCVEFGARWVRVKVVKPRKFDDVEAVGIVIERRARDFVERVPEGSRPLLHVIGGGMVPGDRSA